MCGCTSCDNQGKCTDSRLTPRDPIRARPKPGWIVVGRVTDRKYVITRVDQHRVQLTKCVEVGEPAKPLDLEVNTFTNGGWLFCRCY
jgi:hypothetical protein